MFIFHKSQLLFSSLHQKICHFFVYIYECILVSHSSVRLRGYSKLSLVLPRHVRWSVAICKFHPSILETIRFTDIITNNNNVVEESRSERVASRNLRRWTREISFNGRWPPAKMKAAGRLIFQERGQLA